MLSTARNKKLPKKRAADSGSKDSKNSNLSKGK